MIEMPRPRLLLLVLGGLLSVVGTRVGYAQSSSAVKTVSDTIALDSTGALEVENHKVRIAVTTWERDAVAYSARIVPAEGESSTPLTSLDVTRDEGRLELGPDYPWRFTIPGVVTISPGGPERPRLRFAIVMPRTAQLEIDAYSASVDVAGVEGTVEIDTYEGPVEATGLGGGGEFETYSGDARIDFAALTAPVSIETYSGPVRLTLPADTGFELETEL
jgi:hypothetical protein